MSCSLFALSCTWVSWITRWSSHGKPLKVHLVLWWIWTQLWTWKDGTQSLGWFCEETLQALQDRAPLHKLQPEGDRWNHFCSQKWTALCISPLSNEVSLQGRAKHFSPNPNHAGQAKMGENPPSNRKKSNPPPQTKEDSKPFSQTSVRERELIFHGKWSPRGLMSPNPRSNLDSIYGLRLTSFLVCPEMGRLHKLRRKMCTVWYGQWIGVRIGMKKIDLRLGTKCTRWYEK